MKCERLRSAYKTEDLARVYASPYDHSRWPEHEMRIKVTATMANVVVDRRRCRIGADLSCGDGALLRSLNLVERHFGDLRLAEESIFESAATVSLTLTYKGFIENTINLIPYVDVFLLTETLEHLNWPEDVLAKIAEKANCLILSTPLGAWGERNPEHYWAWDREWVENMAREAGFRNVEAFACLDCRADGEGYLFGIWGFSK